MNNLEIIKGGDIKAIVELFKEKEREVTHEECQRQYDVTKHKIFDRTYRPDKLITKDVIINGVVQLNDDGTTRTIQELVPVERIGLPVQNYIVEQRIGFMLTIPVDYGMFSTSDGGKTIIEMVEKIQAKNRMDLRNKDILRRQMSEMECAELWYFVPSDELGKKFSLRCKLLSPMLGDTLIPIKDSYGDLVAFGRKYKINEGGKEIEHLDIYTSEYDYKYVLREDVWKYDEVFNIEGKVIPNPTPKKAIEPMA